VAPRDEIDDLISDALDAQGPATPADPNAAATQSQPIAPGGDGPSTSGTPTPPRAPLPPPMARQRHQGGPGAQPNRPPQQKGPGAPGRGGSLPRRGPDLPRQSQQESRPPQGFRAPKSQEPRTAAPAPPTAKSHEQSTGSPALPIQNTENTSIPPAPRPDGLRPENPTVPPDQFPPTPGATDPSAVP
jgi:hypothetical protein